MRMNFIAEKVNFSDDKNLHFYAEIFSEIRAFT